MNRFIMLRKDNQVLSAYFQDKELIQVQADPYGTESILGNIYVGKVKNIVKNINAAFIEIAGGQMCYYSLEENHHPIFSGRSAAGDAHPVRVGDELLVQVAREAVKTKAPVVTGNLNLTGRYVVLAHGHFGVGVSSKITEPTVRERLKELAQTGLSDGFGLIVRTNAETASEEEFVSELASLKALYEKLCTQGVQRTCFSAVYRTPPAYLCALRDSYDALVDEIITDDTALHTEIQDYMKEYLPEEERKLRLYQDKLLSLDHLYGISHKISEALREKVWLKSGGNIIIQPTEALTVIDVNTGKAIEGKKKAQETFRKMNLEAAAEIAKQIRLRNLSGIILIDFIDLESDEAKKELLAALDGLFRLDPVKTRLIDMTALGLVEVTRKKIRRPLYEQLQKNE